LRRRRSKILRGEVVNIARRIYWRKKKKKKKKKQRRISSTEDIKLYLF
jgi:hypothetical protein